jgi:protein SCO1/2
MNQTQGNNRPAHSRLVSFMLTAACVACVIGVPCATVSCRKADEVSAPVGVGTNVQTFPVAGVVTELKPDGKTVVIKHGDVTNYMAAMTMPFKVKDAGELTGLQPGDEISFRLRVTEEESWIDQIAKTGQSFPATNTFSASVSNAVPVSVGLSLLDFKFTNEFGQPVSFNDFKGQAVAFTFFFTRCPIPEYCPRLLKNFAEASQKLKAMPDAPTNWHFLSVSFDSAFDTPAVLRAYARRYNYDTNHWSFLTGPPDKIAELATASGVSYTADGPSFNHNFRTLVVDAAGQLQMSFPIGGNLSDMLVGEIFKAAAVTNK